MRSFWIAFCRVWMIGFWPTTSSKTCGRNFRAITWYFMRKSQRSEEHTSELQSQSNLVCRLLLEKKNKEINETTRFASVARRGHCVLITSNDLRGTRGAPSRRGAATLSRPANHRLGRLHARSGSE